MFAGVAGSKMPAAESHSCRYLTPLFIREKGNEAVTYLAFSNGMDSEIVEAETTKPTKALCSFSAVIAASR